MGHENLNLNKVLSGPGRTLFMLSRRGLTLVELLIVIFIFMGSTGCFVLAGRSARDLLALIELTKARAWLQGTFIEAVQTGRPFMLKYTTRSVSASKLQVQWLDTLEEEIFDSGRMCYFRGMSASENSSIYSPKWYTLTPGLTLKVTTGPKSNSRLLGYIVISPYCRITIRRRL